MAKVLLLAIIIAISVVSFGKSGMKITLNELNFLFSKANVFNISNCFNISMFP